MAMEYLFFGILIALAIHSEARKGALVCPSEISVSEVDHLPGASCYEGGKRFVIFQLANSTLDVKEVEENVARRTTNMNNNVTHYLFGLEPGTLYTLSVGFRNERGDYEVCEYNSFNVTTERIQADDTIVWRDWMFAPIVGGPVLVLVVCAIALVRYCRKKKKKKCQLQDAKIQAVNIKLARNVTAVTSGRARNGGNHSAHAQLNKRPTQKVTEAVQMNVAHSVTAVTSGRARNGGNHSAHAQLNKRPTKKVRALIPKAIDAKPRVSHVYANTQIADDGKMCVDPDDEEMYVGPDDEEVYVGPGDEEMYVGPDDGEMYVGPDDGEVYACPDD